MEKSKLIVSRDRCKDCKARSFSAFKNVREEDLIEIDRLRSLIEYGAEAQLPLNFDGESGFYCVKTGHLKLNWATEKQRESTLRICGPGDLVGYGTNRENELHLQSLGSGSACFFPLKTFRILQTSASPVSNGIIEKLAQTNAMTERRVNDLSSFSVKKRVASLLLNLSDQFGSPSSYGAKISVKLDRNTLSNLAATGLESFARTLTELEQDKIIRRDGRDLHIVDRKSLQKLKEL